MVETEKQQEKIQKFEIIHRPFINDVTLLKEVVKVFVKLYKVECGPTNKISYVTAFIGDILLFFMLQFITLMFIQRFVILCNSWYKNISTNNE